MSINRAASIPRIGVAEDWEALRQYTDTPNADAPLKSFPYLVHADIKVPDIEGLDNNEVTLAMSRS